MQIGLQPAFVLHTRPYRETSVIAELLLADYGRLAMVVRGVRSRRSKLKGLLQPFLPLLVSAKGRGDLKTPVLVEAVAAPLPLKGSYLFSGLYINELLLRLVQPEQILEGLFTEYRTLLVELASEAPLQPVLRLFEKHLLEILGVAPSFSHAIDGEPIHSQKWYQLDPEQGFLAYPGIEEAVPAGLFSGELLQAMAAGELSRSQLLGPAKQLNRRLLSPLLGHKPLRSRELFRQQRPLELS